MNKDNWVIVITSYLNYCTSENKIKAHDLDEYFMLNSSFKSLFEASKEYDVKVVVDMIVAIKEIILNYDLLNREFYGLLQQYLTTLYVINFGRVDALWKHIFDIFLNLIESPSEIIIQFAMEFLTFIANYTMQQYVEAEKGVRGGVGENLEKCVLLINILVNKKSRGIYTELFGILENMIDANGHKIPSQYWKTMLQTVLTIVEFFHAKDELNVDLSKKGRLSSLRADPEDQRQLSQHAGQGVHTRLHRHTQIIPKSDREPQLPLRHNRVLLRHIGHAVQALPQRPRALDPALQLPG